MTARGMTAKDIADMLSEDYTLVLNISDLLKECQGNEEERYETVYQQLIANTPQ